MEPQGLDHFLERLPGILALEDAARVLEEGASLALWLAGATTAFATAGEKGRPLRGGWAPKSPDLPAAARND